MSITKNQIKLALKNSGYLLEDRVNKVLKENKWDTIPNDRYKDIQTETEREIDIVAIKNIGEIDKHIDFVNSTLLIECMNNKEPIAFFENLERLPSRIAALNFNVFNKKFDDILFWAQNELDKSKTFIYSSQYCSFQQVPKLRKEFNEGWIAMHPDIKHDSLNSLFQFIRYHQKQFENYKRPKDYITGSYYRPVIILQGKLFSISQEKTEIEINEANHIKYQISKTDNNGRYFLIDIITEEFLPTYLNMIEKEDLSIREKVIEHREKLLQ